MTRGKDWADSFLRPAGWKPCPPLPPPQEWLETLIDVLVLWAEAIQEEQETLVCVEQTQKMATTYAGMSIEELYTIRDLPIPIYRQEK